MHHEICIFWMIIDKGNCFPNQRKLFKIPNTVYEMISLCSKSLVLLNIYGLNGTMKILSLLYFFIIPVTKENDGLMWNVPHRLIDLNYPAGGTVLVDLELLGKNTWCKKWASVGKPWNTVSHLHPCSSSASWLWIPVWSVQLLLLLSWFSCLLYYHPIMMDYFPPKL